MTQHKRPPIPAIQSEIAIALAHLGWSVKQLVSFSSMTDYPVSETFLEDALAESWFQMRWRGDDVQVFNLTQILGELGIGLQDDVFGVVLRSHWRLTPLGPGRTEKMLTSLVTGFPKAQLRLTIHGPSAGNTGTGASLLVNTGRHFLLADSPDLDGEALVHLLYAQALSRLSVLDHCIPSIASLPCEAAVASILKHGYREASTTSKARLLELIRKG